MKKELADKLIADFPLLYKKDFWFEVEGGWAGIIREASEKLYPLIQDCEYEDEDKPRVSQIKQKFGSMRFYLSSGSQEMFDITRDIETKSETVCEACGAKSKIRAKGYWLINACDNCWEEELEVQKVKNEKEN